MKITTDLHLHSKYSRAVSKNMTLETMAKHAVAKGLDLLTVGDFTHPLWLKEIQETLMEKGSGVYGLKEGSDDEKKISFLLSTEISSIYKQDGKLRRIHSLIFLPTFSDVEKFNSELVQKGCNIKADGRPIVGLSARDLLELILSINEKSMLIPCHIWTPHFGVYGSASGFDSLKDAFGDLEKYVYGIETGISSDPLMNWQIPELSTRSILSFSDAHSPAKMGREATVMELGELSYEAVKEAIMAPSLAENRKLLPADATHQALQAGKTENRVIYTIEFYPEEGKYHFSGHRNCKVSMGPGEIREKGDICPVCKRRMTEGVYYRLEELAKKDEFSKEILEQQENGLVWRKDAHGQGLPFVKLVPLLEVIAKSQGSTTASKKVQLIYDNLIAKVGNELEILLNVDIVHVARVAGERVGEGLLKMRKGDLIIKPGYDGEYGVVTIWEKEEMLKKKVPESQIALEF